MKDWFIFFLKNKLLITYGFLLNYFSSFGQTFFVSLFVPYWISSFAITNVTFGSMYGAISVVSAFTLPFFGKYIDTLPLRIYSIIVLIGLLISVIVMATADVFFQLLSALFLLRLFGQGLMTHTSSTGIAKLFEANRGKALAITSLGHPVAQFTLPLLVAACGAFMNWRTILIVMAALAFAVLMPLIVRVREEDEFVKHRTRFRKEKGYSGFLKTKRFWIIAVNIYTIPFLSTAIMLYQYLIADGKGWDSSWVLFSFSFFAVSNGISLLLSGSLIDRFGGVKVFPYYLLPALIGFLLMGMLGDKWVFPLFYALLGTSSGMGMTIKTAVQAEIYGTTNLGEVRSYLSMIMVLGTAAGPPFLGYFIDKGVTMDYIMLSAAAMLIVTFLLSFKLKN